MKSMSCCQMASTLLRLGILLAVLFPDFALAVSPASCFNALAVPVYPPDASGPPVNPAAASARFLNMATFGARPDDMNHIRQMTFQDWLNEQFAMKASCHVPVLNETQNNNARENRIEVWFRHAVTAPDQLRQRVAFALSEIFVVSDVGSGIQPNALAFYYDILVRNAFGNFRDILERVTLSPAMGRYLSMLHNQRANRALGIRADENYAREVMQLFTIGLVQLETSGAPLLRAGNTIPTYSQTDVENSAKVLTGWAMGDALSFWEGNDWRISMKSFEAYHDRTEKTLLNKTLVPAQGKAADDLKILIDRLFRHRNVGPFIGRRLIQRLVTSNPSPEYIQRVADKFNNNGLGVRGDMKAVITAVLLDPEALGGVSVNPNFGKLREPLIVLTHLWRAFDGHSVDGTIRYYYPESSIGQAALSASSVFNFFRPDFAPSGSVKNKGLFAPEFQLVNDANNTRFYNELFGLTHWWYQGNPYANRYDVLININGLKSRAIDSAKLIDYLNLVLTGNKMRDDLRTALLNYIRSIHYTTYSGKGVDRALEALYLIMSSPHYLIQR